MEEELQDQLNPKSTTASLRSFFPPFSPYSAIGYVYEGMNMVLFVSPRVYLDSTSSRQASKQSCSSGPFRDAAVALSIA